MLFLTVYFMGILTGGRGLLLPSEGVPSSLDNPSSWHDQETHIFCLRSKRVFLLQRDIGRSKGCAWLCVFSCRYSKRIYKKVTKIYLSGHCFNNKNVAVQKIWIIDACLLLGVCARGHNLLLCVFSTAMLIWVRELQKERLVVMKLSGYFSLSLAFTGWVRFCVPFHVRPKSPPEY